MTSRQRIGNPWPDDASEALGSAVEFRLSYKGPLPSTSDRKTRVKAKHEIRTHFSGQLWNLIKHEPRLADERYHRKPANVKSGRMVPVDPSYPGPFFVEVKGIAFCPLVERSQRLTCHLAILLRRREPLGAIVHGGDLDNRLKTLLDALRIPQNEHEVPDDAPYRLLMCLLEDDSLVTKLSIETAPLLDSLEKGEAKNDVRVDIDVDIRSQFGHWLAQK